MIVMHQFTEGPDTCAYLPQEESTLDYVYVAHLTPEEYEERMNAGWRKFGAFLFHPVCAACTACRSLRVLADQFTPNRSQQRALAACADLTLRIAEPTLDRQRFALYRRYHAFQKHSKGWPGGVDTSEDYAFNFVHNPIPSLEISIWEHSLLRAVILTDVTPHTISGIYHFYDPDLRDRSIGTFAILQTILLAQQLDKPYVYFGYYVAGCGSLSYKANFRPCEILDTNGVWQPME
jgi:leucyl-tRNA---protein transferase